MKQYTSVIITGSIAFDEIMDFPGAFVDYFHPEKLHQINVSFVVDRLEKQLGGIATNIAYNVGLVSPKKIHILSAIGKDGEAFIRFFKKRNISTNGILIDKKLYTATGKVITDIRDNQIWGYYYGALIKTSAIDLQKYSNPSSLLVVAATHQKGFLHHQQQAITLGTDYVYDPGMTLTWIHKKDLQQGIVHCRYLVGNDYEMTQILRMLRTRAGQLLRKNICIITTLGEKGVQYQDTERMITIPAVRLKRIVDPTGAGDAFRGGFVAGLAEGKPIEDCLRLGNVLASFAIEKYGTVNHRPKRKQIEDRIKELT